MDIVESGLQPTAWLMNLPPLMTVERFADAVGLRSEVVRGWVYADHIPTAKVGKYRLINIVALVSKLSSDEEERS